jgi:hypothetical protein
LDSKIPIFLSIMYTGLFAREEGMFPVLTVKRVEFRIRSDQI